MGGTSSSMGFPLQERFFYHSEITGSLNFCVFLVQNFKTVCVIFWFENRKCKIMGAMEL